MAALRPISISSALSVVANEFCKCFNFSARYARLQGHCVVGVLILKSIDRVIYHFENFSSSACTRDEAHRRNRMWKCCATRTRTRAFASFRLPLLNESNEFPSIIFSISPASVGCYEYTIRMVFFGRVLVRQLDNLLITCRRAAQIYDALRLSLTIPA